MCLEIDRKHNIMWCERRYENTQFERNETAEKQEAPTKTKLSRRVRRDGLSRSGNFQFVPQKFRVVEKQELICGGRH